MANRDSPTPADIMADIDAMFAEMAKPRSLTAATYSGPAGQLRFVGFAIPADIPDERYVTVVID